MTNTNSLQKNVDSLVNIYHSNFEVHKKDNYQHHVAALIKGRKIIRVGCNQKRTIQKPKLAYTLHAEVHCIRQMFDKAEKQGKDLHKYSILVIRIKRDTGEITYSKPCEDCIATLKHYGIKKVYYSGKDGRILCEKVSEMRNNPTNGQKILNKMISRSK